MAESKAKLGAVDYVVGFCSFIPVLGLLLGAASIVLGAIKFKAGGWKIMLLGVGGIFFTVGLGGAMIYIFYHKLNSDNPKMFEKVSKNELRSIVMALEVYKQVHGQYPGQLKDLQDGVSGKGGLVLYDMTGGIHPGQVQLYHYELTPDGGYYLLGVGADQQPFTADDVLPDLTPDEMARLGFRKKDLGLAPVFSPTP